MRIGVTIILTQTAAVLVEQAIDTSVFFEPAIGSPTAIAIRSTSFNTLVYIAEHTIRAITIISTAFGALVADTDVARIAIIIF